MNIRVPLSVLLFVLYSMQLVNVHCAPARDPEIAAVMDALMRSKEDSEYIKLIQLGEDYIVVPREQNVLKKIKVYDCKFTYITLIERSFVCVYDPVKASVVILTNNYDAISRLFQREGNVPRSSADAVAIALAISELARPGHVSFVPILEMPLFVKLIRSDSGIEFKPFNAVEEGPGKFVVTGLFLRQADVVQRRMKISQSGVDVSDKIVARGVGVVRGLHN